MADTFHTRSDTRKARIPALTRRAVTAGLCAAAAFPRLTNIACAQDAAPPARFGMEDVLRRARDIAGAPFDASLSPLPEPVSRLDFDAWREIRFRPDKALPVNGGGAFRLQAFHLGHLYKRPVTINMIRDGIAAPIPYAQNLFDYGRAKIDKLLPVNLGFAGFRLHTPLNDPRVFDELIAFLGASYFRFLARGQNYGLSARALTIGAGTNGAEEFPFFREFWIETAEAGAGRATIYALLDSEIVTGAYRFDIYPGSETVIDTAVTLFARRLITNAGFAPLTSMFFSGENDKRLTGDFRPELHDSDGLLIHTGAGEWIWRPLRNPAQADTSAFIDRDIRGFGLVQRDRAFEHYQDLDLAYERRPTYWVEPREGWAEGKVELVELPTSDETNDNIVASFAPKQPLEPGKPFTFGYRLTALGDAARLSPGGRVVNTYRTQARALGSAEPAAPGSVRFIVDFAGGDLAYFAADPAQVEAVASASNGKITRSFLVPNGHTGGFRAAIDAQAESGQTASLRVFLRAGARTLTETWTFPFKAE